jgi:2-polyprenyl-3-methyl-5-hydroxy-6-metoxy-1,4-benzoquinol methylase
MLKLEKNRIEKKLPHKNISTMWPSNGLEAVACCPICKSRDRRLLHKNLKDQIFFCAPGEWDLCQCSACNSAYLDPRPTQDTIHLAYAIYYTHKSFISLSHSPASGIRRLRRAMANGYRNWRFGTDFKPSTVFGILLAPFIPGFRQVREHEGRNLPRVKQGARLLDIGFGSGEFLDFAQHAGWKVSGADPDLKAVQINLQKGFDVRQGDIFAFTNHENTFDAITLSHVIEHVHDPRSVIREAFRLLKPGGVIWVETPNINSLGHKHFGPFWRGLEPPRHLVLFNWSSLQQILHDEGFHITRRVTRLGMYRRLAAKSRLIACGDNPNFWITFIDRFAGMIANLHCKINHERTEFITILAQKPNC